MKRILYIFTLALTVCSCATMSQTSTVAPTRGNLYPKMYEEKPVSLLVLPPMNYSSNVEAKDYLYTSISRPLIDAGYYVIPTVLSMEILRAESAYDAELFVDKPLTVFKDYFGADAVVFAEIQSWSKIGFGIETNLRYYIKSTHTGEILFDRSCQLYLDTSSEISNNDSLLGVLLNVAASAAKTATTDHIVAARMANSRIFKDIPRGKYDPLYLQDQDVQAEQKDISNNNTTNITRTSSSHGSSVKISVGGN